MSATIQDIAKATGLAVGTVSKYLNGIPIKEKNYLLIKKAVDELDYHVNSIARGLKTNKTMTVGVLIAGFTDVFNGMIVTEIEKTLNLHGYSMFLCDYYEDDAIYAEKLHFLLSKKVDGIITTPAVNSANILNEVLKTTPVVFFDYYLKGVEADAVLTDNFAAVYGATIELISRGHRKIAVIADKPKDSITNDERLSGYLKALESYYIDIPKDLIKYGNYTMKGGYRAMNELLCMSNLPTAVIVLNYYMTVGAYMAIQNRKINIPNDISFIGFDRIEIADLIEPNLSIVTQPMKEIGTVAVQLLIDRMTAKYTGPSIIHRLKPGIIITDSVRTL